jgi:hypothetical protein
MDVNGGLHYLADLPLGNRLWYPLDRKLCGHSAEDRKTPGRAARIVVTILTELPQLFLP